MELVVLSEDHHGKGKAASPNSAADLTPVTCSGGSAEVRAGGVVLVGLLFGVGNLVDCFWFNSLGEVLLNNTYTYTYIYHDYNLIDGSFF